MNFKFFHKDHVKIEQLDADSSIITIQCPTFLASDILSLIDTLAHSARWVGTQCRMSRTSFINRGRAL